MHGRKVVIVEDEVLIAQHFKLMCEEMGGKVVCVAHNAKAGFDNILEYEPELVLMDVRLGGERDGVDVARDVADRLPGTKIIFVTGSREPDNVERMKKTHPFGILFKPIFIRDLKRAISSSSH